MPRGRSIHAGLGQVAEVEEESDDLILSVKLANGHFESSIRLPLHAADTEKKAFVDAWLDLMQAGIQVGKSNRENLERLKAEAAKAAEGKDAGSS